MADVTFGTFVRRVRGPTRQSLNYHAKVADLVSSMDGWMCLLKHVKHVKRLLYPVKTEIVSIKQ